MIWKTCVSTDLLKCKIIINLKTWAFVIYYRGYYLFCAIIKNGDQHPAVKEFKNYLKGLTSEIALFQKQD